MIWLFIALVVAVALAPLTHFAPSKRQRQLAKMREQAALSGLFVEFRSPPGGAATERQAGAARGGIIYYGRRLPASVAGVRQVGWLREAQGWRSVGDRVVAPACLQDLTQPVIAASIDQGSCGVYWTEAVDVADAERAVDEIGAVLDAWLTQLSD